MCSRLSRLRLVSMGKLTPRFFRCSLQGALVLQLLTKFSSQYCAVIDGTSGMLTTQELYVRGSLQEVTTVVCARDHLAIVPWGGHNAGDVWAGTFQKAATVVQMSYVRARNFLTTVFSVSRHGVCLSTGRAGQEYATSSTRHSATQWPPWTLWRASQTRTSAQPSATHLYGNRPLWRCIPISRALCASQSRMP